MGHIRRRVAIMLILVKLELVRGLLVFFNVPATTEIYTLSLHDALPILRAVALGSPRARGRAAGVDPRRVQRQDRRTERARRLYDRGRDRRQARHPESGRDARQVQPDRKSTRLNSSHSSISYAVFCLKKK